MKTLLLGILLIIIIGFGGLVYRNAVEHPNRPIACPMDALVCPDGTVVARQGTTCTFPTCPPPNVTLASLGISFAIPEGFKDVTNAEAIAFQLPATSSTTEPADIMIASYPIDASLDSTGSTTLTTRSSPQATALTTIKQTAVSLTSGLPVSPALFSSTVLGTHHFTVVTVNRFEGTIDTAYYLARQHDVLRFDAIDRNTDWTNPNLDVGSLPAHAALKKMLATLQGE